MYLEIFLVDFAVFRVFLGISRDFAEIPEFRGSATKRNIRSPVNGTLFYNVKKMINNLVTCGKHSNHSSVSKAQNFVQEKKKDLFRM